MSIAGITSSFAPSLSQMAPLSHFAGTMSSFLYSIPKLLTSFFAVQSIVVPSILETASIRGQCSQLNPFVPQNRTPIWTDGMGQYILNPEDLTGSYLSYAENFAEPFRAEFLEPHNLSSLVLTRAAHVPQKLYFGGALREQNYPLEPLWTHYQYADHEIGERAGITQLATRVTKIIESWYPPGTKVTLRKIEVAIGSLGGNKLGNEPHFDAFHHALATIPASEYPFEIGALWRARKGRLVRIQGLEKGGIKVDVIKGEGEGETMTLLAEELKYAACASGKSTRIIPGVLINPDFDADEFNDKYPGDENTLSKYTVATKPSYLLSGRTMHQIPSIKEPNQAGIQTCEEFGEPIKRRIFSISYQVEQPVPSKYDESSNSLGEFNVKFYFDNKERIRRDLLEEEGS